MSKLNHRQGNRQQHSSGAPKFRTPTLIGLGFSLLIHALGIWFFVHQPPLPLKSSAGGEKDRLIVSLAPPVPDAPPQPNALEPSAPSIPQQAQRQARKPQHAKKPKQPVQREKEQVIAVPAPKAPEQQASPSDDMFTQLEAKRKRRAEMQAQESVASPDLQNNDNNGEARNDNSVALANIATSLRQARRDDQNDAGGVFQVRRVGVRDAEVFFRGWSSERNRSRTRIIEVERGSEIDIQTAIVKKMIEVIREEKKEDFIWESRRLGREFSLSARPQDSAQLQRFLMKELFPEYYSGGSN